MFQIIFHWLQQPSPSLQGRGNKQTSGTESGSKLFISSTSEDERHVSQSCRVAHHIAFCLSLNQCFKKTSITSHLGGNASIIDTRCRVERSDFKSWARRLNVWASRWRALNCWHESGGTFWDSIKSMSHLKSSAYKIITRFKRLNHLCLLNIEWSISRGRKRFQDVGHVCLFIDPL